MLLLMLILFFIAADVVRVDLVVGHVAAADLCIVTAAVDTSAVVAMPMVLRLMMTFLLLLQLILFPDPDSASYY